MKGTNTLHVVILDFVKLNDLMDKLVEIFVAVGGLE